MADFKGKELHRYFTWVASSTGGFIRRSEVILKNQFDDDMIQAKNQVIGGLIVTFIARLEKELNKKQGEEWANINSFYAKDEFLNFCLLRHCFAHASGYLLPNRKNSIKAFEEKLNSNNVLNYKKEAVPKYYYTDGSDMIWLNQNSIGRIADLCKELLAINGLIDKKSIHPETNW